MENGGGVQWFSTKEKNPDDGTYVVMVQESNGEQKSYIGCRDDGEWFFMNEEIAYNIVLWCEIPQPPKRNDK